MTERSVGRCVGNSLCVCVCAQTSVYECMHVCCGCMHVCCVCEGAEEYDQWLAICASRNGAR